VRCGRCRWTSRASTPAGRAASGRAARRGRRSGRRWRAIRSWISPATGTWRSSRRSACCSWDRRWRSRCILKGDSMSRCDRFRTRIFARASRRGSKRKRGRTPSRCTSPRSAGGKNAAPTRHGTNGLASVSKPFVAAPFALLWRLFFAQFFTSESVTSDIQLRERAVWVVAFLMMPVVVIVILLYPEFTAAVIRARVGRGPASYVDDMLEWVAFVLTTYSMAGTGLITVLAWDALTFDRPDAAILGPLPLRRVTMMTAKLAALGTLLAAGALPINLLNAAVFAFATSDLLGGAALVTHFAAIF